ncbi:EAL domain-containing protein [Paenibacillaceae bacterium]|nr:EAL domain-containing protein [Paenibacillaceae bacterium]
MEHDHGTYNSWLVILSYIIAAAASYSAFDLAGRIRMTRGKARLFWLCSGAISMGLGIWSMHFVGMLAYSLSSPVSYQVDLVLLSVLLAVAVSAIALMLVSREEMRGRHLLAGGLLMAAGIAGMHYVGMAAMMIKVSYDAGMVAVSIIVAAGASLAALFLLYRFRLMKSGPAFLYKLGSGLLMGGAIAGMHYIGMAAAQFHAPMDHHNSGMDMDQGLLAYLITAGTLVMISFTLFGVFVNKRLSQKDHTIEENERWYRSLYDNHSDGIISVGKDGTIIGFNPAASKMIGLERTNDIHQPVSQLSNMVNGAASDQKHTFQLQSLAKQTISYETTFLARDGSQMELNVIQVPVEIDGRLAGNHLLVKDITVEMRAKEQIHHLAYHDELTGLPNRRHFNKRLQEKIQQSNGSDDSFAVFVLDVDRFKMINDSLGHSYGDQFLREVGERIQDSIAAYDVMISRMGGDEFTLICEQSYTIEELNELASSIIKTVHQPFHINESDFYVTASIGIALYPDHGAEAGQLLRHADTAMYEVKKNGKNGWKFFTNELDNVLLEKLELESDLRKAVRRNELLLHYQPQIRTGDHRMIGIEALVRWQHPTKGMLSPGKFIALAEEIGLIYDIGTWVLREACRQMKQWHLAGGPLIPISVNLSAAQFHQENLVIYITKILEETGLSPEYLELEITESMMMDPSVSAAILKELNQIGIRISLDDFGTGYSSLSYLKLFSINKLKIDRSFITDITMNEDDKAIVATIIAMAQHLKMEVIAEGIETKDQLDILTANDCKEIQGFYFSRPLSANDVEDAFFVPLRQQSITLL